MTTMQKDLRLPEKPLQIECFDNSNIQGSNPVAACVVFRKGKPFKKDYRHFNIKTVEGPDDYASMREIIFRRYKRILDEKQDLPQLIIIDGGKGQLSSAVESLDKLGIRGKVSIIGIAKKLEEIYFPDDSVPLYIDKKSETLKIIQNARNEAHRFGIEHHRNQRSKAMLAGTLSGIKGIGKETEKLLLRKFKSVKRVRGSSKEDLIKIVGIKRAELIIAHFKGQKI
jgi:excinuclease ABC subunit C